MSDPGEAVDRREFLGWVVKCGVGAVTAIVAIPLVGFVLSPLLTAKQPQWYEVGPVDNFRLGKTVLTTFPKAKKDAWVEADVPTPIYVRREGETKFAVFDPRCTHLGCMVQWSSDANQFFCPCHAAVFNAQGVNVAGPAPRPLDRYEYKVERDTLYVGELQKVAEKA